MINYGDIQQVNSLSLITSCGCNLQCAYCRIAKSANENSVHLQQKTMEALESGEFLTTITNSLSRIAQSPAQIEHLSFWGQEPTLTLHLITKNMPLWIETFPNLKNIFFSTNSMAHIDRIFDFLVAIDQYAHHPMQINIQFSYDGDESTNTVRNANSSIIYQNIEKLLTQCNAYNFSKVTAIFDIHGVISIELLKRLNTVEKIKNYYTNLYEFGCSLKNKSTNQNVRFTEIVGLALENPVDACSHDGVLLANFIGLSLRIDSPKLAPCPIPERVIDRFIANYNIEYQSCKEMIREHFHIQDLDSLLQLCSVDEQLYKDIIQVFTKDTYCANGVHELKIMYDGTLVNCQNSIFETDIKYMPQDDSVENAIKRSAAKGHYFINLLTSTDEEINKYFYTFNTLKHSTFGTNMSSVIILMKMMLKMKQIDLSYNNEKKLLNHAFKMALLNCCHYNNLVKTGSMMLRATGQIRFFCNGFLDYLDVVTGGF